MPAPSKPISDSPGPKFDLTPSMTGYPGSKAASGVCERIIRQMPPHQVYIEAFAGYAAVFRRKRPAASSILIDADPAVCDHLRSYLAAGGDNARAEVLCADSLACVRQLSAVWERTTLFYVDPPYLRSVRTRLLYDVEFSTPASHASLLKLVQALPCMVMASHYDCKQYRKALRAPKWRMVQIPAMTRGGMRTECLWCNFPEPAVLHDSRFAGGNFRERERIKRKQARWKGKFAAMPATERQAIAAALVDADRAAVEAALQILTPDSARRDP